MQVLYICRKKFHALNVQKVTGLLLGDNGYTCSQHLLTPVLGARPDSPEEEYNTRPKSTRNAIERVIGQLKNKFRCLIRKLEISLDTTKAVIVAACVLFNIAKDHNDEDDFSSDSDTDYESSGSSDSSSESDETPADPPSGTAFRSQFIQINFSSGMVAAGPPS
ncbi:uncharacterized protein LOC121836603 [Ixodes scapularis]|uniref:uncharacterized protein LOC121836603 n=1 Tax=Ixodes scapularis TaxID=6945 RepID=UPI001C39169A|nr:uncharacterized protein LOC121836603 [Ixodes scapularis]